MMKYTPMQLQRLRNGLTQEHASKRLDVSRSYLSLLETYQVRVSDELLNKMIKLYQCTMKDLFPSTS